MAEGDRERGLYSKYVVYRLDRFWGSRSPRLVTEPCFVLKYDSDPHARAALAAYAESCEQDFPLLARDLRARLGA